MRINDMIKYMGAVDLTKKLTEIADKIPVEVILYSLAGLVFVLFLAAIAIQLLFGYCFKYRGAASKAIKYLKNGGDASQINDYMKKLPDAPKTAWKNFIRTKSGRPSDYMTADVCVSAPALTAVICTAWKIIVAVLVLEFFVMSLLYQSTMSMTTINNEKIIFYATMIVGLFFVILLLVLDKLGLNLTYKKHHDLIKQLDSKFGSGAQGAEMPPQSMQEQQPLPEQNQNFNPEYNQQQYGQEQFGQQQFGQEQYQQQQFGQEGQEQGQEQFNQFQPDQAQYNQEQYAQAPFGQPEGQEMQQQEFAPNAWQNPEQQQPFQESTEQVIVTETVQEEVQVQQPVIEPTPQEVVQPQAEPAPQVVEQPAPKAQDPAINEEARRVQEQAERRVKEAEAAALQAQKQQKEILDRQIAMQQAEADRLNAERQKAQAEAQAAQAAFRQAAAQSGQSTTVVTKTTTTTTTVQGGSSVDELVARINKISSEGATVPELKEVATKLQQERAKPENKEPATQKKLNEALALLLKAMQAKR